MIFINYRNFHNDKTNVIIKNRICFWIISIMFWYNECPKTVKWRYPNLTRNIITSIAKFFVLIERFSDSLSTTLWTIFSNPCWILVATSGDNPIFPFSRNGVDFVVILSKASTIVGANYKKKFFNFNNNHAWVLLNKFVCWSDQYVDN